MGGNEQVKANKLIFFTTKRAPSFECVLFLISKIKFTMVRMAKSNFSLHPKFNKQRRKSVFKVFIMDFGKFLYFLSITLILKLMFVHSTSPSNLKGGLVYSEVSERGPIYQILRLILLLETSILHPSQPTANSSSASRTFTIRNVRKCWPTTTKSNQSWPMSSSPWPTTNHRKDISP